MQESANDDENDAPQSLIGAMFQEFNNMREKEKMEDEDYVFSPFAGMEKSTVLQEAKAAFNSPQDVKYEPQKCALLITKLIYLLVVGETFTDNDVTEVFFSVTKLFQSNNINLRRMTYLFLKEFAESTQSDNIIIVISSLTKDINNSDVQLYRANAIRVLCKIIDTQMLTQIERYIMEAVVDPSSLIASSALISAKQLLFPDGIHLDKQRRDIINKWTNKINEAANSGSEMVQFHALQLLKDLRSGDKRALSRMIVQYSSTVKSPFGVVLLIRFTLSLLSQNAEGLKKGPAYEFLCTCLRHRSDIVIYEAARAMCSLPQIKANDLLPALTVLGRFLHSGKTTLKFGAVRTLNDLATLEGGKVADVILSRSQEALEKLVTDPNRSIATLALTTLLKIGNESTIDSLIKQMGEFITEIDDESKVVIVKAVHSLCIKYKSKTVALLGFLSTLLREEGGFEFKKVVVDSLINLMDTLPETKESCLFHLSEFIEDCEFTALSTKVLFYLGRDGPDCKNASKFVRYIYNRIILETAQVRAASVSALGKFGAKREELRPSIRKLLKQCLRDEDDEVRDRAIFCLKLLDNESEKAQEVLVNPTSSYINPTVLLKQIEVLEKTSEDFLKSAPLTFEVLPNIEHLVSSEEKVEENPLNSLEAHDITDVHVEAAEAASSLEAHVEELFKVKHFKSYGNLIKTVKPEQLTESETEYLCSVIKHLFSEHIVFQFSVTNTLNDQILLDLSVVMEEVDGLDGWAEPDYVDAARIVRYGENASCFVSYRLPKSPDLIQASGSNFATFMNELRFKAHTIDESEQDIVKDLSPEEIEELAEEGGATEEEYPLEDLALRVSDFVSKPPSPVTNFRNAWGEIPPEGEKIGKYTLTQYLSLKQAVKSVVEELGLHPCEGTGFVKETGEDVETHTMFLAGRFLNDEPILARTQFTFNHADKKTVLKIAVRSQSSQVAELVIGCI